MNKDKIKIEGSNSQPKIVEPITDSETIVTVETEDTVIPSPPSQPVPPPKKD